LLGTDYELNPITDANDISNTFLKCYVTNLIRCWACFKNYKASFCSTLSFLGNDCMVGPIR